MSGVFMPSHFAEIHIFISLLFNSFERKPNVTIPYSNRNEIATSYCEASLFRRYIINVFNTQEHVLLVTILIINYLQETQHTNTPCT